MAKGNLILGTMSGKLGDVVAYNYNSSQMARVRRRTIANPRSDAQSIQRMITATVAKYVSAFSEVLNNAVQTESTKVRTLAVIRSRNMRILRQYANTANSTNSGYGYCVKGSPYVAPAPYICSIGTLPSFNAKFVNGGLTGNIGIPSATIKASSLFPTAEVGQQITPMWIAIGDDPEVDATEVGYCRFAFLDNSLPALVEATTIAGVRIYKLNPAAIDQTKAMGNWQGLRFRASSDGTYGLISLPTNLEYIVAAAVVISEKESKKRSFETFAVYESLLSDHTALNATNAWPTYGDYVESLDTASRLYLDNDTEANQQATSGGNRAPARISPAITGLIAYSGSSSASVQPEVTQLSSNEYNVVVPAAMLYSLVIKPNTILGTEELDLYANGTLQGDSDVYTINLQTGHEDSYELIFAAEGYSNVIVNISFEEMSLADDGSNVDTLDISNTGTGGTISVVTGDLQNLAFVTSPALSGMSVVAAAGLANNIATIGADGKIDIDLDPQSGQTSINSNFVIGGRYSYNVIATIVR